MFYELKPKQQKVERNIVHYRELMGDLISMLEYDNIPEGFNPYWMERYKLEDGGCGIGLINGKVTAFRADPSGKPDAYSIGTRLVGATPVGSFEGTIGVDCVYAWNNFLGVDDSTAAEITAGVLAELDTSILTNIIYARYNPFIEVKDQRVKKIIDDMVEKLGDGKMYTVYNSFSADDLEGIDTLKIQNISNGDAITKLQYLCRAKDDVRREFYTRRGISMMNSTKAAQQTESETRENSALSMIYPIQRLVRANEACEEMNRIFDTNMSVHLSPTWEAQYIEYLRKSDAVCVDPKVEELLGDDEGESEGGEGDDI